MSVTMRCCKPFITVYQDGRLPHFYMGLMHSWNRDQRATKERNVARYCGHKPILRVNIVRMK